MFNPLIAFLVIRWASVELWGAFINLMILVQFGAHVVSWGNREFLLRKFSLTPAEIGRAWKATFRVRMLLWVVFAGVLTFWRFAPFTWGVLILWTLSIVGEQAFDVLILYKKDFRFEFVVELVALLMLAGGIFWQRAHLSVEILAVWFAGTNLFKIAVYTGRYWEYVSKPVPGWEFSYFRVAFPFFLLGFLGMVQSRIDLYSVSYFFSAREVAQYQVFINMMIYLQTIANFILMPFVKNLYRLSYTTTRLISRRLFLFGLAILLPGLGAIYFVLTQYYHISLPLIFYIFGGLFVLPAFYYVPIIYALYKADKQTNVLKVNVTGIVLITSLNWVLFPRVGLLGAAISVAVVRWIVMLLYTRLGRQLI